ncbi:MAG TPA: hypothetical protein VG676_02790 [Chitinophagaceae bacterium]|jgi:hypothetical protein|nr:hypothetical protein [Chitinophagaceae bacterium]
MKPIITIILISLLFCSNSLFAQIAGSDSYEKDFESTGTTPAAFKKHLNFFIVSTPKKKRLDLASRFDILRGKIKSLLRKKKFVSIIARDLQTAEKKIQYRLKKFNAGIGTLWFDSHGTYKTGYSVFYIGKDELNYQSIKKDNYQKCFQSLAPYSDDQSKIVIGSCYGGATFLRKSLHSNDMLRMNGDSLMIGLGNIFSHAYIYASESWVMTKPGLFKKRASVAGHPTRRLYKDIVYRPAWENMGRWNEYNAANETFRPINPVTMDMYGNLMIRSESFSDKEKVKKAIDRNIKKLKPGLLKVK